MPHDQYPDDPMQTVFDGAEAATDALCAQEGCERAMLMVFESARLDDQTASMAYALLGSLAHYRQTALAQVRLMQAVSMGQA